MPLVLMRTTSHDDVTIKTKLSETIFIGKFEFPPMLWHLPVWSRESESSLIPTIGHSRNDEEVLMRWPRSKNLGIMLVFQYRVEQLQFA